jgi:uncharacterized protein YbcI
VSSLPRQARQGEQAVPLCRAGALAERAPGQGRGLAVETIGRVEPTEDSSVATGAGEELATVTTGIVGLFREYYGRGPERAKSYMLDDRYVVCVLRDTMTTVERTLAPTDPELVRLVRLTFQEAMADSFIRVVEEAIGRRVLTYHSQLTLDPDIGFEFFLLDER